jgi:hypothetical protein
MSRSNQVIKNLGTLEDPPAAVFLVFIKSTGTSCTDLYVETRPRPMRFPQLPDRSDETSSPVNPK